MSLTAIIPVPPAAAVSIHKIFNGKSLYDHKILTLGAKSQLHTVSTSITIAQAVS